MDPASEFNNLDDYAGGMSAELSTQQHRMLIDRKYTGLLINMIFLLLHSTIKEFRLTFFGRVGFMMSVTSFE